MEYEWNTLCLLGIQVLLVLVYLKVVDRRDERENEQEALDRIFTRNEGEGV